MTNPTEANEFDDEHPRLVALRQALIAGEASGDAGELDFDAIRRVARERAGLEPKRG